MIAEAIYSKYIILLRKVWCHNYKNILLEHMTYFI